MKTHVSALLLAAGLVVVPAFLTAPALAQGSVNPPGPPGATMKTLQQIWDRIDELDAEIDALRGQNTTLTTYLLGMAEAMGLRLDWAIRTIDGLGGETAGRSPSLAIQPNGHPAISYYHDDGALMYASFSGTSWSIQTVDSSGVSDVGKYSSLAFDPSTGYPAISYYDDTGDNLKYARKSTSGWAVSTVASAGDVGFYSSLGFRTGGYPAIAFYDDTNDRLRLAWWRPDIVGGWTFHTVDDNGNCGRACSLAFDPEIANVSISYQYRRHTGTSGSLRFASINYKFHSLYDPVITEVDGEVGPDTPSTSLAFGPDGEPAIAYFDQAASALGFARYDGASWVLEAVDDSGLVGKHSSLAFDPVTGNPAVSYLDQTHSDLRYAEHDGGAWRIFTVDDQGSETSLAFLPSGMPAIAYYDTGSASLEYAELRSYRFAP